MLSATDVSFAAGKAVILDSVTVEARAGELLAIIGPNGAGKSTLLKLLTGELRPSRGQVAMTGRPIAAWKKRDAALCRAVVSQSTSLSFPFRVFEVVLMGRAPHAGRTTSVRDTHIVAEAMRLVDVEHLGNRIFPTLSGGEQQRVMLARALSQIWWEGEPKDERYLLLDEPTSNLDIAHQHGTLSVARRLAEAGGTVVSVLHDFNLAALYADRIAILSAGRLVDVAPPWEALRPERLESVFRMPMTVERRPDSDRPMVVPGLPDISGELSAAR
ncbi:MAG: heme ABC transporter ATP-binding protein [Pseudomonadota bacterium]